jgi:uncharacterized cupredoxin-like copper-binding protein
MNKVKATILMSSLTAAVVFAGVAISVVHAAGPNDGGHMGAQSMGGQHMGGQSMSGQHMGGDSHGSMSSGGRGGASAIGEPGKDADVTRTIEITIADNNYTPESISVKKGETIRFKIKNTGEVVHEFNIGTAKMHAHHQKEMAMMVEHGVLEIDKINHDKMKMDMGGGKTMEHNDPNSVLLEPKKSAEIIWKFSSDANLEFACNVPGHYESGMMGMIKFSH